MYSTKTTVVMVTITIGLAIAMALVVPATEGRVVRRESEGYGARGSGASIVPTTPSSLKSVMVFTRHGDRSPVHLLPNDRATWPEGLGQLSGIGMAQHVALGETLRSNYSGLLGLDSYSVFDVYARATQVDRTIQSAIALFQGLFPPGTGPDASPGRVQYVPIHSMPVANDTLLRGYNNCPAFDALEDERAESETFREKEEEVAALLETLRRDSGENDIDLEHFYLAYDPLFCAFSHGKPLLNGLVSLPMLEDIISLANWVTAHTFSHDDAGKLAGGNMVRTLRDLVHVFADPALAATHRSYIGPGRLPHDLRKFYLMSAHDTTLASLLAALPVTDQGGIPPYASNVVFEIHQPSGANSGKTYVTAFYNNAPLIFTNDACESLHPAGLDGVEPGACVMTAESFLKATENSFFPDWDAACGREVPGGSSNTVVHDTASRSGAGTVALVALVIVNIIGCAGIGLFVYRQHTASRYSRMMDAELFTGDALSILNTGSPSGAMGARRRSSSNDSGSSFSSDRSGVVYDEADQL